jgi:prolyl 4-hydroxylase
MPSLYQVAGMNSPTHIGRNAPCPCGSGKRYKNCCGRLAAARQLSETESESAANARMGLAYLTANGVPGDPDRGIKLLDKAADAGEANAAALSATVRATDLWGKQDWPQALEYLAKASKGGHQSSQESLRILAAGPDGAPGISNNWDALLDQIDLQQWLAPPADDVLRESPTIRAIPHFISAAACDWLVTQVQGRLARATIYDKRTGGDVVDQRRINSQAELSVHNMGLLTFVLRSWIAALLGRTDADMEIPKVLHYAPGETFAPHYDYLTPDEPAYASELAQRGQRAETFLIYLNDDYAGGETAFIDIGLEHRGAKGDALWFSNLDASGRPDPKTRHAGLPPTRGEKWLFSQWVRENKA